MTEFLGMEISPVITIGNIIEIGAICLGGVAAIIKMGTSLTELRTEVGVMQTEIQKISDVLMRLAVQETRLNHLDADLRKLQERVES